MMLSVRTYKIRKSDGCPIYNTYRYACFDSDYELEGKTFEDVKEKCEPISYSQVKGRYSNRLVIMGDIVEYLTINNGRKLNIASIIEVVLTITALSFIISIFKNTDDKYDSRGW